MARALNRGSSREIDWSGAGLGLLLVSGIYTAVGQQRFQAVILGLL